MTKAQELKDATGAEIKTGEELIKQSHVLGTPFTIVSQNNQHFVAVGNARLTEFFNSYEEALNAVTEKTWDLIINTIVFVNSKLEKQ